LVDGHAIVVRSAIRAGTATGFHEAPPVEVYSNGGAPEPANSPCATQQIDVEGQAICDKSLPPFMTPTLATFQLRPPSVLWTRVASDA
jgi:hypothetical protein